MVSGDFLEISINDPDLGLKKFFPKAGESGTLDFGGFTAADDAQMLDGGARLINQMTRKRWSGEFTCSNDPIGTQDAANAQLLQNSPAEKVITITHISGAVYSGLGTIVGDLQSDLNAGTFTLKVSGAGLLTKQ